MNKPIKQIACMLTALLLLITAVSCTKNPSASSSEEILGIEYDFGGNADGGTDGNIDGNTEGAQSNLQINQSSKGAEVVNNCYVTGYPIAKEKVTLNVMAVDYSNGVDYNGMPFTAFVEQKFNVKLKFTMINNLTTTEKVTLAYTRYVLGDRNR